jgi:hypothetical protein
MRRNYRIAYTISLHGQVIETYPDPLGARYWRAASAVAAAQRAAERRPVYQILNELMAALGHRAIYPEIRWYAYDTRTGKLKP